MSTNKTSNLNMHSWVGTDNVKRSEFNDNFTAIDGEFHATTGHGHTGAVGDGPKITATGLANGAATDTVIGNRTIDDTVAAATGADTPTRLWSKLANMIKVITGKSSWVTAPRTTLENAVKLNGDTMTGPLTLSGDPSQAMHAATRQYVDSLPVWGLNRNALINGNFDVWQRGTSFSAVNAAYTADRWQFNKDGSGQVGTLSQQAFAPGQSAVPGNPKYFLRNQVTTAGSGQTYNSIVQRIEGVELFAGGKATVSFWAKANTSKTLQVDAAQVFGSGGSASWSSAKTNCALTTTWQKFVATFDFPSISGKTVGANNYIWVNFGCPINDVFTIDIAQVQLNAGDITLPFQPRSFAEELQLCQRYYETFRQPVLCWTNGFSKRLMGFKYLTQKRITPTITITSVLNSETGAAIGTTFAAQFPNDKSVELLTVTDDTKVTAAYSYLVVASVDAEL